LINPAKAHAKPGPSEGWSRDEPGTLGKRAFNRERRVE